MLNKLRNLMKFIRTLIKLNTNSVVIYQMGKVGSSSIEKALKERGVHVIHLHKITPAKVYFYDLKIVDSLKFFRTTIMLFMVNNIFRFRNCKVITIVRDPMSRTLSQMFHHIDLLIQAKGKADSRREVSANELFAEIFHNEINIRYGEQWMRDEFNRGLRANYVNADFNKNAGYGYMSSQRKKVLFLKFEKINELEDVIGDFCGVQGFELNSTNRSGNKWYGELYASFKRNFKIDKATFDLLYDNEYYNNFYTKEEFSKSMDAWVK